MAKLRSRSRLRSHRRASVSGRVSSWVQAVRSQGELDDRQPDPVLVEAVQWEVGQAGVFGDPDPVLAAGAAAVAQL